jgi:hypothetical protein
MAKNRVHYRGASTQVFGNPALGYVSDSPFEYLKTKSLMKNQKAKKGATKKTAGKKSTAKAAKPIAKKSSTKPQKGTIRAWHAK